MGVTLRIITGGEESLGAVVFDGPRIVIGRSKGCDLQLLDPTVSARHACIRLEGGSNVIVDEGSTNGLVVSAEGGAMVKLPPRTPRFIAPGERFRVGRVWLALDISPGMATPPAQVRALSRAYLRHLLAAEGESTDAYLEVEEGADAGLRVVLSNDDETVVGRARDAGLKLTDPQLSRRHLAVERDGDGFVVRCLSDRGAALDGEALRSSGRWKPGGVVSFGDTTLVLRDPMVDAAAELAGAADVKLRRAEEEAPPPGEQAASEVVDAPADPEPDPEPEPEPDPEPQPEVVPAADPGPVELATPNGWFLTMDVVVTLVALGLIVVSGFGLVYVLG